MLISCLLIFIKHL